MASCLAGAPALDETDCAPSEPVSVLQLHGDADDTVLYDGGDEIVGVTCLYPGAIETTGDRVDLATTPDGTETRIEQHTGCAASFAVELLTMAGGGHIPAFRNDIHQHLWAFFAAHPKP